jgi:dTDP-glucose 4,6-dehydratase
MYLRIMKNILITGGAGFIGSHVSNHFHAKYPNYNIIVLDALTYAANKTYLNKDIKLLIGDICDLPTLENTFKTHNITDVVHLAAESHVDNSIKNPSDFIQTNIIGTHNLLILAKRYFTESSIFYHVSTDEVYGHLSLNDEPFKETTPYDPRSPYSASKASSDHLVRSYNSTYNLRTLISNCSNNYGPHQHIEKFIPTIINSILNKKQIPIYGDGKNIRDWLWVKDHVSAIDVIFHNGKIGETYNIGGVNELTNIDIVNNICELLGEGKDLITFVEDRKGHDFRYAIDITKIKTELGWSPEKIFNDGLIETINFYKEKFYENG